MQDALSVASKRPRLAIDSNEYWSPKQAVQQITKIEEKFDLTWAEEPARRWDYDGLKLVSRSIKAAVSSGENVNDISDFYPLIANEAIDIVQVGSGTSGITGARQVANLAYAFELPVSLMNCQANFMAHLAAALPNHMALEVVDPGREHVLKFKHTIGDGFIHLSDEPGLGLQIDEKKLGKMEASKPPRTLNMPFPRRDGAGLAVVPPAPGEAPWQSEWDRSQTKPAKTRARARR
jgi:L-alanine-DL-glutamate epimerase-like enolase superfamily enzyme